jgi:hypothetical protein
VATLSRIFLSSDAGGVSSLLAPQVLLHSHLEVGQLLVGPSRCSVTRVNQCAAVQLVGGMKCLAFPGSKFQATRAFRPHG